MKTNTPVGALHVVDIDRAETMFERIVIALDWDSDRSQRVIEAAEQLARAGKSEVLVAHIQELERQGVIAATPRPGALAPPMPVDMTDDSRDLVDRTVERLQQAGIAAEGVVRPGAGSTARELLQIAGEFGATVIVVGDSGSRVTDVLLGGVAHKIARDATCSVLLVR